MKLLEKLHSEELFDLHGNISCQILKQNKLYREAALVDTTKIPRTYALTLFNKIKYRDDVNLVHESILKGSLIGASFRNFNYCLFKDQEFALKINIPKWLSQIFNREEQTTTGKLFDLYYKKADSIANPECYATIYEIYYPNSKIVTNIENFRKKMDKGKLNELNDYLFTLLHSINYIKQPPYILNII